jgi:hypothetical protein
MICAVVKDLISARNVSFNVNNFMKIAEKFSSVGKEECSTVCVHIDKVEHLKLETAFVEIHC